MFFNGNRDRFRSYGLRQKSQRQLYNDKLSKYITLADYKGLKVDAKSDEFRNITIT
ncbi:MAG: hypothetical protein ACLR56_11820 [Oscillospiraceae bacterium]